MVLHPVAKTELYGANRDGDSRRYTVASGTAIDKFTVLQLTSARTASAHSAALQPFAGVASMDKDGSDFSTSITAWTNGLFTFKSSGAIVAGQPVVLGAPAQFVRVPTNAEQITSGAASGAAVIGYATNTVADNGDCIVRINI